MSLIGWSKKFENYEKVDVPARVKKTETIYWCSMLGAIAILISGVLMLYSNHSKFGLFIALGGAVDIVLIKLWAHIRLATYQIILELRIKDKEAQEG